MHIIYKMEGYEVMTSKERIYLAGTIYNDEPGCSWKSRFLHQFIDDMDGQYQFLDPDPVNECDITMVPRDKAMINSSTAVVAYIEHGSVGTSMEIYHAYLKGDIPIIVISPNGYCKGNIWIEAHVHCIVSSVEDAARYIKELQ